MRRQTRQYARRQITWFRHQLPDQAVWLRGDRPLEELIERVVTLWET